MDDLLRPLMHRRDVDDFVEFGDRLGVRYAQGRPKSATAAHATRVR